jgi:hypothetical protein
MGEERIKQKRSCRDILFLLLFIVYWIGMFIIANAAIKGGDLRVFT